MVKMHQLINKALDEHHHFLLDGVELSSNYGMPILHPSLCEVPRKIIPFSKAISLLWTDYDCWVCFYEADRKFERFWNTPQKYLARLKKFKGVITPDFSLSIYADEVDQFEQIFRGRLLAAWLEREGIPIIPNIRYANRYSRPLCCDGISEHAMIAIGTNGFLRDRFFRQTTAEGVDFAIATIKPQIVLVYGGCPNKIFGKYIQQGIDVIPFKSQIKIAHEASAFRKKQEKIHEVNAKQGGLFDGIN